MSDSRKILIVEDEKHIIDFLSVRFEQEKILTEHAGTLRAGLEKALSWHPDLVVLDLGLPDGDGMDFIHTVRNQSDLPIIVLSARLDEMDKVAALDAGADDYMTKPFGTEELMARIRNVMRSRKRITAKTEKEPDEERFGAMTIFYKNHQIFVDGKEIHLTRTEFSILEYLARNAGKILRYEDIINHTWEWIDSGSIKKLQVNMANIRRKLGEKPGESTYIVNELGVGYRMR